VLCVQTASAQVRAQVIEALGRIAFLVERNTTRLLYSNGLLARGSAYNCSRRHGPLIPPDTEKHGTQDL
jgi:hypothetical protein